MDIILCVFKFLYGYHVYLSYGIGIDLCHFLYGYLFVFITDRNYL